ncbi:MAG: SDR family NAD(P)-dependent oxidoreductase [Deltaproteobacteria bacterium]|nr:SDR family NAD(P)-dependent oxidoreductase [Deltaproteobacteria bacterium]
MQKGRMVMGIGESIRFDGKVAIVTGAGGGLGRVYALELGKRGAKVVVNDFGGARDGAGPGAAGPADKVVDEIKALGGEAVANYDNVATPDGGENIVKTAVDAFGKTDILINNAGILRDKGILKMEPENWQAVLDVHLNGAFHVTRPAFSVMRDKGYGRIVMTTSAAGLYGNFGQTNYSSAKLGLVGFMNTLKLEGIKYNIKVNTVAPIAASRLTQDILPSDLLAKLNPAYVAPMVLYLCSEECGETGRIYNCGAGFYNRAAMMTSPGIVVGGGKKIPSVEDVSANWAKIMDLKGAKEYGQLNDLVLQDLLSALEGKKEPAPGGGGFAVVKDVFEKMPGAFQAGAAGGAAVVFQYCIAGDGGGDWSADIKNGVCTVASGLHAHPTCTLTIQAGDFLDLMNGKVKAMKAYTSGKLKIEGEIMKSQLLERIFKF